ncbi:MAG: hypothetical protein QXZ68_00740 [Candidatus Bathyarchaeia archaeon]
MREEERMIDKRTLKASLLRAEMNNVRRIFSLLVKIRYKKLVQLLAGDKKISPDVLADHERDLLAKTDLSFASAFKKLIDDVLAVSLVEGLAEKARKMVVVRFIKDVPAIIGADMKAYGPFKCEDVAVLPVENARILIRQKLAEEIKV